MNANSDVTSDPPLADFTNNVFVNGYGVPDDILTDANYERYLGAIVEFITSRPDRHHDVYLCGGFTNRTDKTEAAAMREWFSHFGLPSNASLHLIESKTTARGNMRAFQQCIDSWRGANGAIFCEYSRRHTMRFFASHLMDGYAVHGVKFDAQSMTFKHRLMQLVINLPLEVLAWHSSWFDSIRHRARARHVARARAENK